MEQRCGVRNVKVRTLREVPFQTSSCGIGLTFSNSESIPSLPNTIKHANNEVGPPPYPYPYAHHATASLYLLLYPYLAACGRSSFILPFSRHQSSVDLCSVVDNHMLQAPIRLRPSFGFALTGRVVTCRNDVGLLQRN